AAVGGYFLLQAHLRVEKQLVLLKLLLDATPHFLQLLLQSVNHRLQVLQLHLVMLLTGLKRVFKAPFLLTDIISTVRESAMATANNDNKSKKTKPKRNKNPKGHSLLHKADTQLYIPKRSIPQFWMDGLGGNTTRKRITMLGNWKIKLSWVSRFLNKVLCCKNLLTFFQKIFLFVRFCFFETGFPTG
ncbi:hypothetical protein U0070_009841, partial [Myodes glareolus]